MACALKIYRQNGGRMKKLKQLFDQITTGNLNKLGLLGILPGKYQLAPLTIKNK